MDKLYSAIVNFLTNEVAIDFNMLCLFMISQIGGNMNRFLTVTVHNCKCGRKK